MNDYARRHIRMREDERRGRGRRDYGEYRGGMEYRGDYGYDDRRYRDRNEWDDDMEMRDGRRGVKGTGPYGIGGRRYYGRDRAMDERDYDYGYEDERGYRMEDGNHYVNGYLRRDYGYDRRRDYGEDELTESDMEKWKRDLVNDDGTRGPHYTKEQAERIARLVGVSPDEFGKGVFEMALDKAYSDGCKVARKYNVDRPEYYGDLALAFLKDKDYDGTPAEKLYTYYKCIAEK